MSLAFPNTVLNTIVAEAIDDLADKLEAKGGDGVAEVVAESYAANKAVCFDGDNYAEEWHTEADARGLKNLRTTPEALPEVISAQTVTTFGAYNVLSERELHSRFEVWTEQYVMGANIEAETTGMIARTMLVPAALRYLALIDAAEVSGLAEQVKPALEELVAAIAELDKANNYPDGVEGLELAEFARDHQLVAMASVREAADKLEKVVADDLWPLPKYSEILFIR
jgi:glutamine synthetase